MQLRKIFIIAWHEFIVNVRRIGFIFTTLLFPALGLLAIVIGAFFSGQATQVLVSQFVPPSKLVGIVDHTHRFTPIPPDYADDFEAFADEAQAKRALLNDEIVSYFVIPADYMSTGKVTSFTKSIFSGSSSASSFDLHEYIVRKLLAGKIDEETLKRVAVPADLELVTLDSKGETQVGTGLSIIAGFVAPYIFSILLFIAVFSSSSYLLRSVSEEKETRVIEIILSSVAPVELMAGKLIGLGAVGLTQVGIWLATSFLFSGGLAALFAGAILILNPGSFILAAVYFLLGYLLFGAIMATAGALGTSIRESQQLAGIFSFTASIPWFFAGVLFANPNAPIARVLSFFPITAPTMMMLRLPMTQVPLIDIVGSIIVLVISIPIALWLGGKLFRTGLLMYGKRPSVKEIWRAVRQG